MRLMIDRRAARAAALVAVAARVFLGLTVGAPTTHNGAWISALIGALLAAPWFMCLAHIRARRRGTAPLRALLGAVSLMDAATVLAAVARSAGYLALDRSPTLLLALPAALAALWCVCRNGDAIGYGGMIWLRIGAFMLVGVFLLQGRYLRGAWLWPLLGEGWPAILEGGIRAAGWILTTSSVLLALEQDKAPFTRELGVPFLAVAVSAALILLRLMMTPTPLNGDAWVGRLDSLLCNGRAPLYLQLPMIALWFAGLMHLLACDCFAAAALLQSLLGRLDGRICGFAVISAAVAMSRTVRFGELCAILSRFSYAAIAGATLLTVLIPQKGGEAPCAPDP